MEIKNKVVLVTGASTGIGKASAILLAHNGAKLALNGRSKDKLEELSKELPDSGVFQADMTDEFAVLEMIEKVVSTFGRIDILINNAGRGMQCPIEEIDINEYRKLIELNIVAPLVAMKAVIPLMRKMGGGTIVNISSGTSLMYAPGLSGYSATKRALNGLSLTARTELAKDNIIVSNVYPYITRSDFQKNLVTNNQKHLTADELTAGRAPADTSEYVAELILKIIQSGEAEIYAHDWMKNSMK